MAHSFWFLSADSGTSWPVADPVTWCLDNANGPVLERASEGLAKLTPDDGDRIIRLVVRRCRLNLLELRPERVVVHFWGRDGLADLRAFFKAHGPARSEAEVALRDRKTEVVTRQTGDTFLYGERLAADFPLNRYLSKWAGRSEREEDDWSAAPDTRSGYAWEGVGGEQIPWAALKSAWRRAAARTCENCDGPTLLVNFGWPWTGLLRRTSRFIHVCGACRRSYRDKTVTDVSAWLEASLDADVRPDYEMVWGRRAPFLWHAPISDEERASK